MRKVSFFCDFCGVKVEKDARSCPSCGKTFSAVRCPKCSHTGPVREFVSGCPSCGYTASPPAEAEPAARRPRQARPPQAAAPLSPWGWALVLILLGAALAAFVASLLR